MDDTSDIFYLLKSSENGRNEEGAPGSPSKSRSNHDAEAALNLTNHIKEASRREQIKTCWGYFKEFTENTSLHGLKYIGEGRRSIIEKIWWCLMFVLSVAACGHLIFKVWNKWQQSPVIVSFAETSTPVWQVPFPAITVCSETKAKQSVYNFTEMYHKLYDNNITDEEKKKLETASLLCDNHLVTAGQNTSDKQSIEFLASIAPTFHEVMWHCKWKTSIENCSTLFSPILTEDGMCFTFNMLSADELFRTEELHKEYTYLNNSRKSEGWSLDEGYPKHLPLDTYPARGTRSGTKAGLTILLKAYNNDLDYLCRGPVQGFKVLLHTPTEIPRVSQQYFRVPLSQEVIAAIKPNMMTTSEGLRNYDPKKRQCYFPSERRLKYYKIYTQQSCEWECLTNYTMQACGCVSLSMPRDESMPICSAGRASCMADAQDDLLTREIVKGLQDTNNNKQENIEYQEVLHKVADECQCLPACTAITYDAETSQADYNWKMLFQSYKLNTTGFEHLNMARVVLFFKESQFITHRRSELYGQTDFLANCGGLLGLFLGFSFLSFIEIIYFFTLRLFCTIKMKITKKETRPESLKDANSKNGFPLNIE